MRQNLGVFYDKTSDFQQEQFNVLCRLASECIPNIEDIRSLLDVGAGTGARTLQTFNLFPALSKVTAIEPDWEMIAVAEASHAHPLVTYKKLAAEDVEALSAEAQIYDVVLSNWALHWVSDKDRFFEGLKSITQSGSYMVFGTCERLPTILTRIDNYIRNEFRIPQAKDSPFFYLDADGWRAILEKHGWVIKEVKRYTAHHEVESAETYLELGSQHLLQNLCMAVISLSYHLCREVILCGLWSGLTRLHAIKMA